jgi:hypothetical protein
VPWGSIKKALLQRAIPDKIEVTVFTERFIDSGITTTNAGAYTNSSATISNMKFIGEGLHKRLEQKVSIQEEGLRGLDYKVWDWEMQENISIPSGTTVVSPKTIDLDQIKQDAFMQFFTIRPLAKVPNGAQSNITNPWYFVKCASFFIKDGTKNLFDEIFTDDHENMRVQEMFPFALFPSPFHIINYCPREFVEASDFNCYGSRALVHYNKPQLVVKFATITPEEYRLDFYSKFHQVLRVQGGGIRTILAN